MDDCLFCRLAARPPEALVFSDALVAAFEDINPQAPTHVLIVPRRHVPSVAHPEAGEVLPALFAAAAEIARRRGIAESGFRTVFNVGSDAGQTVHHLHLHLLGGRPLAWPPG